MVNKNRLQADFRRCLTGFYLTGRRWFRIIDGLADGTIPENC